MMPMLSQEDINQIQGAINKIEDPCSLLVLDTECSECRGDGRMQAGADERQWQMAECDKCQGRGRIPTEFGGKLLKFFQTHIRLTLHVEA